MDCEKFESTLIDELYDELDELTSAASKRHVAGCSRCAGLLGGLKATRRLAVMPLVEAPADLESKILAAVKDAQKVVPLRGRVARVVSLAGSWAMRPQTAMAAVFLLMIGSSVLLVRGRNAKAPAPASAVVTEQGSPAAAAAVAENDGEGDMKAAATAHGVERSLAFGPAASATPGALALGEAKGAAEPKGALKDLLASAEESEKMARREVNAPGALAGRAGPATGGMGAGGRGDEAVGNAAAPAGAPMAMATPPAYAAPMAQAVTPPSEPRAAARAETPTFTTGMAHYGAKRFDEALRVFDALAAAGDANAALWGARTVRDSSGCSSAINRFDQVASRSFGSTAGYDATLEGGRCYRATGSFDTARARFARLLTVPAYQARAQAEIDSMTVRSQANRAPARAAPAAPAAKPAGKSAVDNNGY